MPTIRDVAALAGVSVSTVSIVLNGKAKERKVADKTNEKVLAAIDTLGYKPNMTARRLKSSEGDKPTIALFWPLDYRTAFLAGLLKGIQTGKNRLSYDCEIVVCTFESGKIAEEFNESSKNRFSGAIIGATSAIDMKYLEGYHPPIPTVLFNRYLDDYCTVCADHQASAEKTVTLFAAKGHRRMAVITVKNADLAMSARTAAVIAACEKYGIKIEERFIIQCENSFAGGALAAREFLNLPDRPKALFCDSDFLAVGAAHVFNKEKVRIPEDLEIIAIGMAEPEMTEFSTPSITVVAIPTEEMAADSIGLIYNLAGGKIKGAVHKEWEPKLLARDSCCL
ncbi:MAG: LacI family DNA-binding transcriptional regulator [Treponemataceae bacterium]